jgi:flagellar FliL protein
MAEEEMQTQEEVKEEASGGNFVSIFGKIFLSVVAIGVQIFLALQIMDSSYAAIDEKMASFSSSESVYHQMENIIVNPADSDGERYLLLTIALELRSSSAIAAIDKHNVKITDQINSILAAKTVDELNDRSMRDAIKQEIGIAINQTLKKNSVQNLFFTKYVMQ